MNKHIKLILLKCELLGVIITEIICYGYMVASLISLDINPIAVAILLIWISYVFKSVLKYFNCYLDFNYD